MTAPPPVSDGRRGRDPAVTGDSESPADSDGTVEVFVRITATAQPALMVPWQKCSFQGLTGCFCPGTASGTARELRCALAAAAAGGGGGGGRGGRGRWGVGD